MPHDVSPDPIVLDKFLDQTAFDDACRYILEMPLYPVRDDSEFTIWRRNTPGNPVSGTTLIWSFNGQYPDQLHGSEQLLLFPSGTPLDALCGKVRDAASRLSVSFDEDCVGLIATAYKYGPGGRLIWHEDGAYLAAFSFYLSTDWVPDGGGQFAYKDSASDTHGKFIEPVPNRLVLFKSGLRHSILPTSRDSPGRISLSGFFVSSATVSALLSRLES